MMGGNEPILTADGGRITDSHGRVSRVTSAGYGPSVGRHLLMSYMPRELSTPGTDLQEVVVPIRPPHGIRYVVREDGEKRFQFVGYLLFYHIPSLYVLAMFCKRGFFYCKEAY
jgi:hypothetical protein